MKQKLLSRIRLNLLMRELRERNRLPARIELTSIGDLFAATASDETTSELMSESVATGIATNSDLALLKAVVEYIERRVFWEASEQKVAACLTPRSDGLAAFPKIFNLAPLAESAARKNAYCEAVERYVWSTWWDDLDTKFELAELSVVQTDTVQPILKAIVDSTPIRTIYTVRPTCVGLAHPNVCILVGELEGGGFISGGSADFDSPSTALFRAASEMLRHSLAVSRIKRGDASPESFYERRLSHFGLGYGDQIVRNRLAYQGHKPISLPRLKFDTAIPHELDHLIAVHRCYFEDQPLFVGGELERLCI